MALYVTARKLVCFWMCRFLRKSDIPMKIRRVRLIFTLIDGVTFHRLVLVRN